MTEIDAPSPVKVRASRLTLNRALRNLIINAATHGVQGAGRGRRANGMARIVIEDDGPGIPPDLLCQVFEPFFRADPGAPAGYSRRGSRAHHRAGDHSARGRQIAISNRKMAG